MNTYYLWNVLVIRREGEQQLVITKNPQKYGEFKEDWKLAILKKKIDAVTEELNTHLERDALLSTELLKSQASKVVWKIREVKIRKEKLKVQQIIRRLYSKFNRLDHYQQAHHA